MFPRLLALTALVFIACGPPPRPDTDSGVDDDAGLTLDDAGTVDSGTTDGGRPDAGTPDGGAPDSGTPDGGTPDAGPLPDGGFNTTLVTVGHERELRGVWVATVSNLDWPTTRGLSPDAGRAALTNLVDSMADAGLNAIFFQVRPESDALYDSTWEPWSRFLTGTQGGNPGWDPLEEILRLSHARGIEVHAWMNPYRGLVTAGSQAASNHVTQTLSNAAITYDGKVVMNPGVPEVRQHLERVISDLLNRYDVDGLHFDDYFYPYPDAQQNPFPDSTQFNAYRSDGGTMNLGDWRRDNVNTLVREVMQIVTTDHPQVRFGISPFGIWRSNMPVPGLDAYATIYCDAPTWMANGWVDYLAPQLYWLESSAQKYSTLATWWAQRNMGGRHLFPGHALYQLSGANWPLNEIDNQVTFTRTLRAQGARGDIHFRALQVLANTKGVTDLFRTDLYAKPALPPVLPRAGASVAPAVPFVSVVGGSSLSVTSPMPANVRFFALYKELAAGQWELQRVKGGAMVSFPVTSGAWAVSAIGRGGAESQGVRVVVP